MTLLFEVALKTTAIFAMALGVLPLLHRRSAAVRHFVLTAAFVCAALVPALSVVAPAWRVSVPAPWLSADASSPVTITNSTQPASGSDTAATPASAAARGLRLTSVQVLATIWITGAACGLGTVLLGMWRIRRLSVRARVLTQGRWRDQADDIEREYGIQPRVRLMQSEHPTMLVTWGTMRPRILLPSAADRWADDRIRIVLCHELGHIRRRDWPILITANVMRWLYWFNPLVWIAYRALRQESERACDDLVLDTGVAAADYATHLLAVARETVSQRHIWSPASAIAHPSTLEGRVRAMLNDRMNRTPLTLAGRMTAATIAIAATLLIAGAGVAISAAPVAAKVTPELAPTRQSTALPAARMPAARASSAVQSGPGTITGVLYDQMGGLLPGVTVSLVQRPNTAGYSTTTDRNGAFTFDLLPPGDYELASSLPGFSTVNTLVKVTAGAVVDRSITLPIGTLEENINVVGGDGISKPSVTNWAPRNRPRPTPESRTFFSGGIGGQIKVPVKLVHVSPVYPADARGASDFIVLNGRVGIDGFLSDLREETHSAAATHAAFLESALEAVRQWEFTPTLLNNVPVEVNITIRIDYSSR